MAAGGTALDPEVVAQLLVRRRDDPMDRLTRREQQVLKLMAEGRSNAGIMKTLLSGAGAGQAGFVGEHHCLRAVAQAELG